MQDLFSIKGKVAFITGGSRGIGEMIAAGFLANGAKVYISSRKAAVCDETAKRLAETYGGECISIPGELSQIEGIEAAVAKFAEKEDKLDVLINNAGVSWGAPLEEFPEIGWDKVMDTKWWLPGIPPWVWKRPPWGARFCFSASMPGGCSPGKYRKR